MANGKIRSLTVEYDRGGLEDTDLAAGRTVKTVGWTWRGRRRGTYPESGGVIWELEPVAEILVN